MVRLWPRQRKTGSITLTLTADTSGFVEAMRKVAEAARQMGDSLRHYRQRYPLSFPPPHHAFTPDFDLCCTVTGCNLLPEEH